MPQGCHDSVAAPGSNPVGITSFKTWPMSVSGMTREGNTEQEQPLVQGNFIFSRTSCKNSVKIAETTKQKFVKVLIKFLCAQSLLECPRRDLNSNLHLPWDIFVDLGWPLPLSQTYFTDMLWEWSIPLTGTTQNILDERQIKKGRDR